MRRGLQRLAPWLATCVGLLSAAHASAHAPLGPGDVVVVGVRQGAPDTVLLLALAPLHDGDEIQLTDDGLRADGTHRREEGASFYEVLRTTHPPGALIEVSAGTMSLDRGADQIFLHRGSIDASGTLTGAWIGVLGWGEPFGPDATSTRSSALPWALADAFTELPAGGADMAYVGPTTGSTSAMRAHVADPANWRVGPRGTIAFPTAFDVRVDRGGACVADMDCQAGTFCVDGTCCDTTCGRDGFGHCFGCYFGVGSARNGTCGPASATQLCRVGRGTCDPQETCDGTSTVCPADARAPAGRECRAARDACDVAEVCDGTATSCPRDRIAPPGEVCRAARGECDLAEVCTGTGVVCPDDIVASDATACSAACGEGMCTSGVCEAECADAGASDAGVPLDAAIEADASVELDGAIDDGGADTDAGRPDATVPRRDAGAEDAMPGTMDGGAIVPAAGASCDVASRAESPGALVGLGLVGLVIGARRARRRVVSGR